MYNDFGSELKYTGIVVYTLLPLWGKKTNTKSKNSQTRVESQHSYSVIQQNEVLTKPESILSTEKLLASQAFSFFLFSFFFFLQMFYTMHEGTTFHPLFQYEFGFLLQHWTISDNVLNIAHPTPNTTMFYSKTWMLFAINNRDTYAASSTASIYA